MRHRIDRGGDLLELHDGTDHRSHLLLEHEMDDRLGDVLSELSRQEVEAHGLLHQRGHVGCGVREEHATQLEVPGRDASGNDEGLVGPRLVGREAHHEVATVVRRALHGCVHHRLTNVVEDHIDAAVLRLGKHNLGEVVVGVVDRYVGTEFATQRDLLVGAGRREHPGARVDRELDRGRSGTSGRGVDQYRLSSSELGAVEEPEPREMKREVQRSGVGKRDRLGHGEHRDGRADRELGVTTECLRGHRYDARVLPLLGAGPAGVDDAHHLHPRRIRQLGAHHHVAAGDALEVVEVERDRLHPHAHLSRPGLGDRNGVEPQDLERFAVLVRAPRAHGARDNP